jgi:hypothetical protein
MLARGAFGIILIYFDPWPFDRAKILLIRLDLSKKVALWTFGNVND